ncbi:thioesterase family protein [uncultured Roseivirga sp.]|uniref:acyl-CoA thioesterase n=1 Tax=uncultured Roseivirga sp. TaxID=543088 RepID=UPI0030DA403A|tara:strand:- start:82705 stop:83097 length:393 start_codon:yes stop_codon:yes gene_type:complete
MPAIFESTFKVTSDDLDAMQHVNNVRYLQWVQDISEAHWTQAAKPLWLEQYKWVAINHFIEYKKPAFLGDQIQIKTHVHEHTGVKSNRLVRVFNATTGDLLMQSSSWWCMIDANTLKPTRIPKEVTEAFV